MILQYAMIVCLLHFALHLLKILDFTIGKSPLTITAPPPCFMFGVIQDSSSFIHSLQQRDTPIWLNFFGLEFVKPKDFTPIAYCPVFVGLGPLEPFDIVLQPQQWFLDSNSAIYDSNTELSLQSGCWYIFSKHWSGNVLSNQPSVTQVGEW